MKKYQLVFRKARTTNSIPPFLFTPGNGNEKIKLLTNCSSGPYNYLLGRLGVNVV